MRPVGVDRLTLDTIPVMTDYVTVTQAAEILGITRNGVFYKIYDQRIFNTIVRVAEEDDISREASKRRPVLLIKRWEVEAVAKGELPKRSKSPQLVRKEWNRRVKEWGGSTGNPEFRVAPTGAPRAVLIDAYVAAHPEDPRPE
jgi:hypothetical protein